MDFGKKLRDFKAVNDNKEYQGLIYAYQQYLKGGNSTRSEKRQTLSKLVDQLSEEVFKKKEVAVSIMGIINMKEDVRVCPHCHSVWWDEEKKEKTEGK